MGCAKCVLVQISEIHFCPLFRKFVWHKAYGIIMIYDLRLNSLMTLVNSKKRSLKIFVACELTIESDYYYLWKLEDIRSQKIFFIDRLNSTLLCRRNRNVAGEWHIDLATGAI